MKKAILAIILIGMISWTLYETMSTEESSPSETTEISGSTQSWGNNNTDEDYTPPPEEEVGLTQGDYAPDFKLALLNGEKAKLSDFRGQKIMLNFWATWCPPCRAEMPDMQEVFEENEIMILAVNLTETEPGINSVESFVEDFGLTFPIMLDEDIEVANMYQIQPIPTSFMIDSEGRIQSIAMGPMNKDMMLQRFSEMN